MANERRGNLSEAYVVLALEKLGYIYGENIHWGITPSKLKVCTTDISVGTDKDNPDIIFQVTSSGYAGNYQMKFWRDMGELFEIRNYFPKCRVVSIVFEPGAKKKLRTIFDFVSDGIIDIISLKSSSKILDEIKKASSSKKLKQKKERIDYLKISTSQAGLEELSYALEQVFKRSLNNWELGHEPQEAEKISDLNLRKAILVSTLYSTKGSLDSSLPFLKAIEKDLPLPKVSFLDALHDVGICKKTLAGYKSSIEDLNRCIKIIGAEEFLRISKNAVSDNVNSRLPEYVETIQNLPLLLPWFYSSIIERIEELCESDFLSAALIENYNNFSMWLPEGELSSNEPWLFRRILDLLRSVVRKHFGIGIPMFDRVFVENGMQAFRFIISDYIAGRRPLTDEEASLAAKIISGELKKVLSGGQKFCYENFCTMVRRSEFQQRMLTYRGFDPLPTVLKEKYGIEGSPYIPQIVVDFGISGAGSSVCKILDGKIVMWQSASKLGVAHKVNEMVGRMGLCCLEAKEDNNGKITFRYNKDLAKREIFLDGAWDKKHVDALLSGCFTKVQPLL